MTQQTTSAARVAIAMGKGRIPVDGVRHAWERHQPDCEHRRAWPRQVACTCAMELYAQLLSDERIVQIDAAGEVTPVLQIPDWLRDRLR